MISRNLTAVRQHIESVCRSVHRDSQEITLVAATKYASVAQIRAALEAGLTDIGESKVQDAQEKFSQLGPALTGVTKHMIGHLQTNKVKRAVQLFDLLQSVDSVKLVREIERRAAQQERDVAVLIEINASGEEQKYGASCEGAFALVDEILKGEHIILKGLMTVGPLSGHEEIIRQAFRQVKRLSRDIIRKYAGEARVQMQYLSMGMTQDYPLALEEGANMLRIGSAIFA